ncbi:glycyl-radical enzyme activating protein [bacterium]|nr:glycyl-radical enzyme activating protein [bacterium]
MSTLPLIVDLQRGSTEDGPGIRTTVFFKGCPLACKWCQNPETQDPNLEIGFYPKNCINCFDCEKVCPEGAILKGRELRIDRVRCSRCGRCAEVCPGKGLRRIGKYYEIGTILEALLRDRVFYERSGGGVTLSGGEPTLWPDYAGKLLRRLKLEGIHTAIQTCGYFEYATFKEEMLPWLDLIMYDLKFIDPKDHFRYTGQDNKKILENFRRLLNEDIEVMPRIPLIPKFTASKENLEAISNLLKENCVKRYSFLPYNPFGSAKLENLGKKRPLLKIIYGQ